MEDHVLIHVDPHLTPGLKEILRRKRDDKLLNLIINKGTKVYFIIKHSFNSLYYRTVVHLFSRLEFLLKEF
jgi:hypothetical protein